MIAVFDRERANLKAVFLSSFVNEIRHIVCARMQTEGYETQLFLSFLPLTLCFPFFSLPIQKGLSYAECCKYVPNEPKRTNPFLLLPFLPHFFSPSISSILPVSPQLCIDALTISLCNSIYNF
jgi:hypothetical protein